MRGFRRRILPRRRAGELLFVHDWSYVTIFWQPININGLLIWWPILTKWWHIYTRFQHFNILVSVCQSRNLGYLYVVKIMCLLGGFFCRTNLRIRRQFARHFRWLFNFVKNSVFVWYSLSIPLNIMQPLHFKIENVAAVKLLKYSEIGNTKETLIKSNY